jgi:hemerythrin superfamily protein
MAKKKSKVQTPDALEMLINDHEAVRKLMRKYKRAKDVQDREEIISKLCAGLTNHALIEEEIFYPAVREAMAVDSLLNEAEVEHAVAKDLVEQLMETSGEDPLYEAKFKVLCEYVSHHIAEEEQELFPKVRRSKIDLSALAEAMSERNAELVEMDDEAMAEEQ